MAEYTSMRATRWPVITPSNNEIPYLQGIWVTSAGNVTMTTKDGAVETEYLEVGYHPLVPLKITASDATIRGLF